MKNFWRSLTYLKPYRVRIGVAIGCVIIIACLWGSGLGLILPASKTLISPEGLHGWAYISGAGDRLGAKLQPREAASGAFLQAPAGAFFLAPDGTHITRVDLESVVDVIRLEKQRGPAGIAGIKERDWLVGVYDPDDPNHLTRLRDDDLVKELAGMEKGGEAHLLVLGPKQTEPRTVTVKLDNTKMLDALLLQAAHAIPDPGNKYEKRFPMFVGVLVIGIIMELIRALFTFIQEYLIGTAIWRGVMDLRSENYNVVLHLPMTYFSEKGANDAMSRFIQDIGELARGQNTLLGKTMVEPAKAIASLAAALWFSPWLTVMALLAGPAAFYMIRRLGKSMHKASRKALESWSALLAVLEETLTGIRVVKAYTMEGAERRRFFRVNRQLLKQQAKMERLDAATGPVVEALGVVLGMGAAGIAGYLVFYRGMDRDVFLAWMVALFAMFDPARKLAKVSMRFQASEAAAKRIFELHDTPQEKQATLAKALQPHHESIEFRDVTFRYPNAGEDALKDVNLTILAGETVAIVGPNGSGKTTLVSLLPRLIDPSAGAVLIDGQDIAQSQVRSLRRQIGLVTQDTVIFHASIKENVSYGLRRPKEEDVLAAAKKARVDDFVQQMPKGYDSVVGEHGSTLSGGQKQRIAIARAILRDPAILIFDEATSQIDPDSEQKIHEAMAEFIRGRTALIIAHRLITVLWASRIVVMDRGRIVDLGTHDELLKRCPLYGHLYKTQFAGQEG